MTSRALGDLGDELRRWSRIGVVAAGKAAVGMAEAATAALGGRLSAGVVTAEPRWRDGRWQTFAASHPVPSEASEAAGRAALALASGLQPDDLLLVCLSGGASAMLAVPAPGLTLDDKQRATSVLLRAGLDISSLNIVRRHLSAIKGGRLAACAPRTITLAISDVTAPVEDDPIAIGSGPTVGDPSTFADALRVIDEAGLAAALPGAVMAHLRAGADGRVDGPIGSDDARLRQTAYWVVGSRQDAMRAAADMARRLGYDVHVHQAPIIGRARDAAPFVVGLAAGRARPVCVIASGETTVRVVGHGRGGRNQELAAAALEPLAAVGPAALASIGTDGVDGPTDAAGAIVTSDMWAALGPGAPVVCSAALDDNDSYPFLERLGALVKTGTDGNECV